MDALINSLPIELHLPSLDTEEIENGEFSDGYKYSYCGPGTRFDKRVEQGYEGINELDKLCKSHDEAYSIADSGLVRRQADYDLAMGAWALAKNSDLDYSQRLYAALVSSYFGTATLLDKSFPGLKVLSVHARKCLRSRGETSSRLLQMILADSSIKVEVRRNERFYDYIKRLLGSRLQSAVVSRSVYLNPYRFYGSRRFFYKGYSNRRFKYRYGGRRPRP
jgi:hypothetical protein